LNYFFKYSVAWQKKGNIPQFFYGGFPPDTAPTLDILQQQFPASSSRGKKSDPNKTFWASAP